MKIRSTSWLVAGIVAIVIAGCSSQTESYRHFNNVAQVPTNRPDELVAVAPPPFTEGVFPCSNTECHKAGTKVNKVPHEVGFHSDIELHHDEKNRWCLDCHDTENRNVLHLADGRPVEFTESYRLCGQCHGPQLRAWRAGEHGKRTGSWNGKKEYRLCVSCHDPHSPHFKPLKPERPPVRQELIK